MGDSTLPDSSGTPNGRDEQAGRRVFVRTGITAFGACYAGAIAYPVYRYLHTPARRSSELAAVTEVVLPEVTSLNQARR